MVEVRLRAVRVDLQSNTPVLLLQESEGLGPHPADLHRGPRGHGHRLRPPGDGHAPADDPRPHPRPARGAGRRRGPGGGDRAAPSTYYAEIVLLHAGGEVPVSSRPSDAVAVAVRTGAPLFVADDLMDAEGIMLAVDEEDDEDDEEEPTRRRRQPRGDRRRVPQLPRQHPAGGLLLLTPAGAAIG